MRAQKISQAAANGKQEAPFTPFTPLTRGSTGNQSRSLVDDQRIVSMGNSSLHDGNQDGPDHWPEGPTLGDFNKCGILKIGNNGW